MAADADGHRPAVTYVTLKCWNICDSCALQYAL